MSVIASAVPGVPVVSAPDEIRVMVVDDATVVRSLLSRWIDEAPGLKLVAALRNGREAIERLDHARPDVVVLDVEMPELDGISTLPKLLERRRDLSVIMVSALTRDHAEVTLKALSLGAADYIPKPAAEGGVMTSVAFQRELIEKIQALGLRRKKRALSPYPRRATVTPAGAKPVREAVDGEPVLAGHIYLAPGGRHMMVARRDGTAVIVLDDGAPVHYCKPAVDPLFASAAEVWGSWNLALVLTGMGTDGTTGAAEIVKAGGSVIAQDEATSVVWGMPGSAVSAGVCSAVLPLEQIAPKISRLFLGARS